MEMALLEEYAFLTWEFLGTFLGAVTAVTALTQVIKQFIKVDPKWISLALSFVIMLVMQVIIAEDLKIESFVISAFNALIVTASSIGIFESALKGVARKFKEKYERENLDE